MNLIRYNKPAKKWREALPLGNGYAGLCDLGSIEKPFLKIIWINKSSSTGTAKYCGG